MPVPERCGPAPFCALRSGGPLCRIAKAKVSPRLISACVAPGGKCAHHRRQLQQNGGSRCCTGHFRIL
jgi:hypothetical protein